MSHTTMLHPPVSEAKSISLPHVMNGERLINAGTFITMMKNAGTSASKRLYRLYVAEYRALEGHPVPHAKREADALGAALARAGVQITQMFPEYHTSR